MSGPLPSWASACPCLPGLEALVQGGGLTCLSTGTTGSKPGFGNGPSPRILSQRGGGQTAGLVGTVAASHYRPGGGSRRTGKLVGLEESPLPITICEGGGCGAGLHRPGCTSEESVTPRGFVARSMLTSTSTEAEWNTGPTSGRGACFQRAGAARGPPVRAGGGHRWAGPQGGQGLRLQPGASGPAGEAWEGQGCCPCPGQAGWGWPREWQEDPGSSVQSHGLMAGVDRALQKRGVKR